MIEVKVNLWALAIVYVGLLLICYGVIFPILEYCKARVVIAKAKGEK